MGSRREEERNEKIIRGLMKLPPNRRCINCNSLGPQYVCTNFWTFVCMACSGIHREFTHRVKSVSMAKFSSQEVEALQNGGNQRARETYLRSWDPRQRLPDSSNTERVREFIKSVYVEKKYTTGNTSDKPPRDIQRQESSDDVTKRSSSYHSYSQSPPYDYQYEERRYGKRAPAFIQKSGSAHGGFFGKVSSFGYSPGRRSDLTYEDRFANEGFGHRASDFSVSSGGDPFRSAAGSPTSLQELGYSSPPFWPARSTSSEIAAYQMTDLFPDEQSLKTSSSGDVRSLDGSSSLKSFDSGSLVRTISSGTQQDILSAVAPSPVVGGLDLFQEPMRSEPSRASAVDLVQKPQFSMPECTNKLQASSVTQISLVDLFTGVHDQHQDAKPTDLGINKNEGWATFDCPQPSASPVDGIPNSSKISNPDSSMKVEGITPSNMTTTLPPHQSSTGGDPAYTMKSPWPNGPSGFLPPDVATTVQPWSAFDEDSPSLAEDRHLDFRALEDSSNDGQRPGSIVVANNMMADFYTPAIPVTEAWNHASESKSTNPFDLPYETELDENSMFLDMSTLHVGLPNVQATPSFLNGGGEPWFPKNTVPPYVSVPPGTEGLAFMAGQQVPSVQLPNVQAQEPIASTGGNPFA